MNYNIKSCKIYALICPISKDIRYIGQTCQKLETRLYQHWRDRNQNKEKNGYKNNWINKIYNEYKLKPNIILIENLGSLTKENENILNEREKFWIDYYFSKGKKLTNTSGKMYFRNLRKTFSKGKIIYAYNRQFKEIIFKNAREASKALNINYKTISDICKYKRTNLEYCFSFTPMNIDEINNKFNTRNKTNIGIISKNLDTGKEILFKSQKEASIFFKVNFRNINQVLKGIRYSCNNHTFKYSNSNYFKYKKINNKRIIDLKTNEIFESARQCSIKLNIKYNIITYSARKNKINSRFKYIL